PAAGAGAPLLRVSRRPLPARPPPGSAVRRGPDAAGRGRAELRLPPDGGSPGGGGGSVRRQSSGLDAESRSAGAARDRGRAGVQPRHAHAGRGARLLVRHAPESLRAPDDFLARDAVDRPARDPPRRGMAVLPLDPQRRPDVLPARPVLPSAWVPPGG